MSTEIIEQKLEEIVKRVEALEHAHPSMKKKGGWQAIAGQAKGDDHLREALQLGAEWRAQANTDGR